ncbi:MAG: altronate dehydrogenase [candidate division Zixibacteria bacterium]|nr:altronate dehydrogenase [candidate division Zixibacteria bacterium]
MSLPETFLQFGSGKFLRAFTCFFVHEANKARRKAGNIVVVQSTAHHRAAALNAQQGRYHLWVRGLQDGKTIDETHVVESVSRALEADSRWGDVLETGASPDIRYIVSNTSERGYELFSEDRLPTHRPRSFPARLTRLLYHRFQNGAAPVAVLPLELIDDNAATLKRLVMQIADAWYPDHAFSAWLSTGVVWLHTLVDRITIDPPSGHPLLAQDPLLTVAEPFAFWAVEAHPDVPLFDHPAICRTADVMRYALRKFRILNGAHTALVCKALPLGLSNVREAVEHPETGAWLRTLVYEEIIPAITGEVDEPEAFAQACLERFRNPFLDHRLTAIAVDHETKVRIRLMPTYEAFLHRFGRRPPLLSEALGIF